MTDPLSLRAHLARRLAALAAIGTVGTLSPLAVAAPAHAAPAAPCPARFGATAASELVALRQLDLAPLGLNTPALADLHVGTAHAGMAGGPPHSAAEARLLRGHVAGLPIGGVLPQTRIKVYQEAPPSHDQPTTARPGAVDVGGLHLGVGTLSAQATLRDSGRCAPGAGPVGESSATVADARVLGLLGFETLTARTYTEVVGDGGRPAAAATASGDVARFQLFAGTAQAITVRVISPARLRVVAGARKTVEYTAPVLEVTAPGRPPLRLSGTGGHLDVAIPVDAGSAALAGDLARAEGIPLVSALPLGALVPRSAPLPRSTGPDGDERGGVDILRDLPGVPALTGLVDDVAGGLLGGAGATASPGRVAGGSGRVVVLRVALGELSKETSATGVHAKAAAVRVKLLVRSKWAGHGDGYGGTGDADRAPLLDLGVCVLEAAAATPERALPPYGGGGGTGGGTGGSTDNPGGGGSLPVTGDRVALVLGAGTVLLVAGRLLLVLARRRSVVPRG